MIGANFYYIPSKDDFRWDGDDLVNVINLAHLPRTGDLLTFDETQRGQIFEVVAVIHDASGNAAGCDVYFKSIGMEMEIRERLKEGQGLPL